MLFSSKDKLGRLELIFDIQSSIVRGSLMLLKHGEVPHILWMQSVDITYRPKGGSAYLIKMAVRAVEDVSMSAHAYVRDKHDRDPLPPKIAGVHFVLTSPWIVSRARTISQKFPKDTRITRARIAEIIKAERSELSSDESGGLTSIEEKIFDVRLNGYSIPEWEGNMARTLEVSFALSIAGNRMIEYFAKAARRAGAHETPRFHSSLLLQHAGMMIATPLNDSYALVHAHGELTDLVMVDNRSCVLFGSHPVGVHTIVRNIAHALKISEPTADSLLSIHEDGKLSAENDIAGIRAIEGASAGWVNGCKKLIAMAPENRYPTQAVISARTHEKFFRDSFITAYPSVKTSLLNTDDLTRLVTFDPKIETLRLTVLYAVAIQALESL